MEFAYAFGGLVRNSEKKYGDVIYGWSMNQKRWWSA